jgi:hypothetical protein
MLSIPYQSWSAWHRDYMAHDNWGRNIYGLIIGLDPMQRILSCLVTVNEESKQ